MVRVGLGFAEGIEQFRQFVEGFEPYGEVGATERRQEFEACLAEVSREREVDDPVRREALKETVE